MQVIGDLVVKIIVNVNMEPHNHIFLQTVVENFPLRFVRFEPKRKVCIPLPLTNYTMAVDWNPIIFQSYAMLHGKMWDWVGLRSMIALYLRFATLKSMSYEGICILRLILSKKIGIFLAFKKRKKKLGYGRK